MDIKFNNKAIGGIYAAAMNMTTSKCDGCDGMFPLGKTQRWAWVFYVCPDCLVLARAGQLSLRQEGEEAFEDAHCSDCERPMALSKYRVLNGVETVLYQRVSICLYCREDQASADTTG